MPFINGHKINLGILSKDKIKKEKIKCTCNNFFLAYPYSHRKYCSEKCYHKSQIKDRKIIKCLNCNKKIRITFNDLRKYCSRECSNKSNCRNDKISKTMKLIKKERKEKLGYINSPQTRKKMSKILKAKWKDPVFAQNIVAKTRASPNKLELNINYLLKKIDKGWEFTGDGKFVIGYPPRNPDFVHKTKRLILEVFGRYWHKEEEVPKLILHYKKYNFNCVIFWDDELKNINSKQLNKMIINNL